MQYDGGTFRRTSERATSILFTVGTAGVATAPGRVVSSESSFVSMGTVGVVRGEPQVVGGGRSCTPR
jgi:hypothetical protein